MARALTEEPKETEEETATDVVNFQGCVLVMCFFALILLFCFKMPWYSRVFVHLFSWCVCCFLSFLLGCQFAFCEALLTSLKHISLLSNENSLKKTQNSPLKRNTPQNKCTLKHPTSSHTSCSTPSTAACPTSPFSRAPRGASPPPPGTARAAPSPPPGSDGPAR